MNNEIIKVLIIDDSKVSRDLLAYIVELDPQIKVIGFAEDGIQALNFLKLQTPDVIITDIEMPNMNGFQLTRAIMESNPLPIIIVSGVYNQVEIASGFEALDAGALAIIEKPKGLGDSQYIDTARFVAETIKTMANLKLDVKTNPPVQNLKKDLKQEHEVVAKNLKIAPNLMIEAVAIGASIGGPKAIRTILSQLSTNFPVPIFIVQHISPGFMQGFINWLKSSTTFQIKLAEQGEVPVKGTVYLCPDQKLLTIDKSKRLQLRNSNFIEQSQYSISALFESINQVYGKNCISVLLTGVGKDGAQELLNLKEKGAVTLVQDEHTSIKFELPENAIKIGAALRVLPLNHIAIVIDNILKARSPSC